MLELSSAPPARPEEALRQFASDRAERRRAGAGAWRLARGRSQSTIKLSTSRPCSRQKNRKHETCQNKRWDEPRETRHVSTSDAAPAGGRHNKTRPEWLFSARRRSPASASPSIRHRNVIARFGSSPRRAPTRCASEPHTVTPMSWVRARSPHAAPRNASEYEPPFPQERSPRSPHPGLWTHP